MFEVMVAVVVITTAAALVLRSFNSAIVAIKGLKDYTLAMFLAEQKMFEVESSGGNELLREGTIDVGLAGGVADTHQKFSWKVDSVPLEGAPLNKIDLSILWGSANSSRKYTIQTYIRQK